MFVVIVGLHGVRGKYALADASLKMADPNRFRGKDLPVLDQLTDPPGVRRVYHIQAGLPDPFQPPASRSRFTTPCWSAPAAACS